MWKKILWTITIITALTLIFSMISVYISPANAKWISLIPFALKYALIVLVAIMLVWLFVNYKIAIPLALIAFVGLKFFSHEYSFRDKSLDDTSDFKVMSYNVRNFGLHEPGSKEICNKQIATIAEENPDILCLQEAYWHNKPNEFPTINELVKKLNAKSYYKFTMANFNYGDGGLSVICRYPIIGTYTHHFDSTSNGFIYVDMHINNDTVRLYNCHLQSIKINNNDVDIKKSESLKNNSEKAKGLYSKFSMAAERRAHQVDTLIATIDTCPYPIMLCGDFNDVPLSYTCFSILNSGERLHDTFMERGKGNGRTYNIMDTDFRIDYIMHSKHFKCLRHKVLDFNVSNDHYPVVAEFKI